MDIMAHQDDTSQVNRLTRLERAMRDQLAAAIGLVDLVDTDGQPVNAEWIAHIKGALGEALMCLDDVAGELQGRLADDGPTVAPFRLSDIMVNARERCPHGDALNVEYDDKDVSSVVLVGPGRHIETLFQQMARTAPRIFGDSGWMRCALEDDAITHPSLVLEFQGQDTLAAGFSLAPDASNATPVHDIFAHAWASLETAGAKVLVAQADKGRLHLSARIPLRSATPVGATDYPLRVLVVDDVLANRQLMQVAITSLGFSVVCVGNGQEAVDQVMAETFDLVLMDIHMPVMDGCEATQHIRKLKAGKGAIPILAVTADTREEMAQRTRKVGMNGVIHKPVNLAQLLSEVSQWGQAYLEARRAQVEMSVPVERKAG